VDIFPKVPSTEKRKLQPYTIEENFLVSAEEPDSKNT
jgi:hypothetical protein